MSAALRTVQALIALLLSLLVVNIVAVAEQKSDAPLPEPRWRQAMSHVEPEYEPARRLLREAEKGLRERHQPIVSTFSPITAVFARGEKKTPLLIYRNFWGIVARNADTGELAWEAVSDWSLEQMLNPSGDNRRSAALRDWLKYYAAPQNHDPHILFANSLTSRLSTDGRYVYAVDDLAVPPPPPPPPSLPPKKRAKVNRLVRKVDSGYGSDIESAISRNRLQAYDLKRSGVLAAQLGGAETDPQTDCCFLGPPLPLDGKLYAVIEKKQELGLARLEWVKREPKSDFWKMNIESIHPLNRARLPLSEQPYRRVQAVHPIHSDGILICPTNNGTVFGFDVRKDKVKWSFAYRKKDQAPPPASAAWLNTAPVIAEGKVIFTAPDSPSIHCLNLRDGNVVWERKKLEADLYLGGIFADKVLLVGKSNVRGLSLSSGETLWTLETGLPSGFGVAAKDGYYLPLKEAAKSERAEICVLDVKNGRILGHRPWRGKDAPGNLSFAAGKLISLSPWEIAAYP